MNTDDVNVDKIFNLAIKNHKENNFSEAEKLYKKILKINSSHFNSIFYLASLSAQTKNYSTAKNLYEKAVEIQPSNVSVHNNLGAILLQLGDHRGALISFQSSSFIKVYGFSSNES